MAAWTKRSERATARFVGYFPTPQFWAIIDFWKEEQVKKWITILSLNCSREKMFGKNVLTPLPYMEVTKQDVESVVVDHDFMKHGDLDIDLLCKRVSQYRAKDMVVKSLCVKIPKDLLAVSELEEEAKMMNWKTGKYVVAMFRRTHAKSNGSYIEQIKKHTKDWLEMGGKLSSLDLVGLREAHYWHRKGEYGAYEINFMPRTVTQVMIALDPDRTLGRIREYRRKTGETWSLVGDHSLRER